MAQQQNRRTAYKIRISDLINGSFVKEDGWEPNYILVNGSKVSRVNLICAIVSKEFNETYQSILIDDGSDKISVRAFDEKINFDGLEVGDIVLLIARLREFNGETYLTPEIIRKVENKGWIELRKLELGGGPKEKAKEEVVDNAETSVDRALTVIRELDNGEGAVYENVVKKLGDEGLISELLKQGELFEPKPGKLKVLE